MQYLQPLSFLKEKDVTSHVNNLSFWRRIINWKFHV